MADPRKDKEDKMTTEPKKGRGRPKKETYVTLEAPVEKAEVAPRVIAPIEYKNYVGSIFITPTDPAYADVHVGSFYYHNRTGDIIVEPQGDPVGWPEFYPQIMNGTYILDDPRTGGQRNIAILDHGVDWINNIEKASFKTPKGVYTVRDLSFTYEVE